MIDIKSGMKGMLLFISFLIISFMCGCTASVDRLLDHALEQSGDNASEIQKVLDNYKGDKKETAEFLISSMLGRYSYVGAGLDSIEAVLFRHGRLEIAWEKDRRRVRHHV